MNGPIDAAMETATSITVPSTVRGAIVLRVQDGVACCSVFSGDVEWWSYGLRDDIVIAIAPNLTRKTITKGKRAGQPYWVGRCTATIDPAWANQSVKPDEYGGVRVVFSSIAMSPKATFAGNDKCLIALKCLRCGKGIQIEKQSADSIVRCPFCRYRNAFHANRPSRFEPVLWFPLADDADGIRKFVEKRKIGRIVHFTSIKNLIGIFKNGKLLSRMMLESSNGEWFHANDSNRWDGHLNYINASIERINVFLFNEMVKRGEEQEVDLKPWCILEIDPICLEKRDVLFTVDNAASRFIRKCGTRGGLDGLSKMFAETVMTGRQFEGYTLIRKIPRSSTLPLNWTTTPQAEVLLPGELSIQLLDGIVFQSEDDKKKAIDRLNECGVVVPKDIPFRVDKWMFEGKIVNDNNSLSKQ